MNESPVVPDNVHRGRHPFATARMVPLSVPRSVASPASPYRAGLAALAPAWAAASAPNGPSIRAAARYLVPCGGPPRETLWAWSTSGGPNNSRFGPESTVTVARRNRAWSDGKSVSDPHRIGSFPASGIAPIQIRHSALHSVSPIGSSDGKQRSSAKGCTTACHPRSPIGSSDGKQRSSAKGRRTACHPAPPSARPMGNKDHRLKAARTACHPRSPIGSSDGKQRSRCASEHSGTGRRKYEPMRRPESWHPTGRAGGGAEFRDR